MSKTVTVVDRIAAGDYSVRAYAGDNTYVFRIVKEGNSWVARNQYAFPVVWDSRRKNVVAEIELFDQAGLDRLDNYQYNRSGV